MNRGKSKESASKICGSLQSSQEKEANILYSHQKISFKEEGEEFYSEGFVATTHKDRDGDILSKNAISKIVESINNQFNPSAGAASNRHDWIKQGDENLPLAGMAISAEERQTEDGFTGAYIKTHHHKFHPEFDQIKYNVEHGYYPGYSIEFETLESHEVEDARIIDDLDLVGYGFANMRMIANPHAAIDSFGYKEMISIKALHHPAEDKKRAEEEEKKKKKKKKNKKGDNKMSEHKDEKEIKEEDTSTEEKEEEKEEEKKEDTEEKEVEEQKEYTVSKEDMAILSKFKEEKERLKIIKEVDPVITEKVRKEMEAVLKERSPLFNVGDDKEVKFKEFDDYRSALAEIKELDKSIGKTDYGVGQGMRQSMFKNTIDHQYKEAAKLSDALIKGRVPIYKNWKEKDMIGLPEEGTYHSYEMESVGPRIQMKEFSRLSKIEAKGLEGGGSAGSQIDTNLADTSWTYGSYFLSPVELNDIFQPILVNQLNDLTTVYGNLPKEDWSGRSQIQFRARTGRNSTVGGYSEGANLTYGTDFSGMVGRDKFQQPFSYYRVLLAITGQAQRFAMAPGGMGDRWADEIKWSGIDLLAGSGGLNLAIIGTGDGSSESTSLGFEGLILGTTGTLYGKALSTYATLRSHKEDMSSARVKLDQLRKMIRFTKIGDGAGSSQIHSNSRTGDLVFYTSHLQEDFVKGLYQDMQRLVPTSGRVGFEGRLEIDGVPIVPDADINTDDWFLINHANTKIGVNLPPTLEPLPVTADAQAAHIKTYWNLYSEAPGNNYWAHTFAVS